MGWTSEFCPDLRIDFESFVVQAEFSSASHIDRGRSV